MEEKEVSDALRGSRKSAVDKIVSVYLCDTKLNCLKLMTESWSW